MITSLKTRITIWYILLSTLILIGLGFALYLTLSKNLMKEREEAIKNNIQNVHGFVFEEGKHGLGEVLEEAYERISIKPEDDFIEVFKLDGTSISKSDNLRDRSLPFRADLSSSIPTTKFEVINLIGDSQPALLGVTIINVKGENYLIEIATSLSNLREIQSKLVNILLFSIPLAILLSLIGGAILANNAIEPINRITSTANQTSATNLQARIELLSGDKELRQLADAFNQMLVRLESSFRQIRQFTADASHELRTPLTILIGETQLAVNNLLNHDECKLALRSRFDELQRMAMIVDDLLVLSKFDASEKVLDIKRIDFSDLIIESCEQQRHRAKSKGVNVELEKIEAIEVEGDNLRLRQMLRNLLDNAIKYTEPGGTVKVELGLYGNQYCQFKVEDTGIGIPTAHLPNIFDRFYRVDNARSREQGGSGLGLSIVKQIVEAHGGKISVTSEVNCGTCIYVQLPALVHKEELIA
jgi:heavy metal sensor kinase